MALPKRVFGVRSSIVATVGGLTIFLVVASFLLISFPLLISHPINSSSLGYLRGSFVNQPQRLLWRRHGRDPFLNGNDGIVIAEPLSSDRWKEVGITDVSVSCDSIEEEVCGFTKDSVLAQPEMQEDSSAPSDGKKEMAGMADGSVYSNGNMVTDIGKSATSDAKVIAREVERTTMSRTKLSSDVRKEVVATVDLVPLHSTEGMEVDKNLGSGFKNEYQKPNSKIRNEEPVQDVTTISPSELKIKNAKALSSKPLL